LQVEEAQNQGARETEQQMIRDWVDSQAEQHREIRRLLELMTRERVDK
jgi:hypothetical protein